ncbi:MAG: hypothetical protein JJU02_01980 [Cryomorphaceae bacterium]|nr:hypothetical protein [Cryomorphaceae bacterium]
MGINDLLHFDENVIFNNYGHADRQSFSNHIGVDVQSIIRSYEEQMKFLRKEVEFLRSMLLK